MKSFFAQKMQGTLSLAEDVKTEEGNTQEPKTDETKTEAPVDEVT
jgi:hypothetical protein